jgi:hypothetical protein
MVRTDWEGLMAKKKPDDPGTTYTWTLTSGHCYCTASPADLQIVSRLWEVTDAKVFHDEALMEATKKINRLLGAAAEKSPDPERELCFIQFEGRPFLVWSKTHRGHLTTDDDPEAVADALGIRYETAFSTVE